MENITKYIYNRGELHKALWWVHRCCTSHCWLAPRQCK